MAAQEKEAITTKKVDWIFFPSFRVTWMLKYNQIFFIKRGDGKTQRNILERILMGNDKLSNKKSVQMIFPVSK